MVGQNIGKYRVLDRIGRGGMGTVYRAIDETLHREVAIKVLNAELNDPEVAKRFRAEAITVARLSHPGIATIYELFQHEGQWLMVMEFVRGETLEHMVERMGPLSAQRGAELCMQALAALAHAHSMGVVHRDLKPANLMITETGAVKIMDFGIARVAGTEHLTNAGFMMGTPAYMSPEQVRGTEIDARADLYAMGVVFYRLTTGRLPFKGETPFAMAQSQVNDPPTPVATLRADLPAWVEQVIQRALQKAPEQRFQSAVEFHEAFARCLAGLPLTTMYGSATPTELLVTPSRPMATGGLSGALSTNPPLPPAYSGALPTVATPVRGTTASGQYSASTPSPSAADAPTMVSTSGAMAQPPPVATPPSASVPVAAPPRAAAPRTASASGANANTKKIAMIGAAAAVLIIAVVAIVMMTRSSDPPVPEPVTETLPPPPAPPVDPAVPPPTDPAATAGGAVPPPTEPPPTPPVGTEPPPVAGATPPPATGSAGSATATGAGTTTTTPAGARGAEPAAAGTPPGNRKPAVADDPATFEGVKFVTVNGRRVDDEDVNVVFGGGQLAVVPRKGGAPTKTLPYRRILRATYIRADNPRWDSALPAPTEKFDAGGIFNRDRHWLFLQTKDDYAILRLEGNGWLTVLQTFEARTGLKIERPEK